MSSILAKTYSQQVGIIKIIIREIDKQIDKQINNDQVPINFKIRLFDALWVTREISYKMTSMYYMKIESKNWETLGALTTFFLFWRSHTWSIVLQHCALPNWSNSLGPSHKTETNVLHIAHLFSLCTSELNFGHTIWNKSEVILGTSWGTNWELGEHDDNTLGTRK